MSEFSLEAESDTAPQAEYRVLARKYRPTRFADLIGQDAMVRTLANAIARDRIAHAFLMTGVRGVGKTSTARLIAKALNCIGPDGTGGPTIDPCDQCEPCRAITEGRFIDVVEMDAASHTGVDEMRDVIDSVRYAAVSGRYKIHIIDEVHMLSKSAFNALLKTLEEPPPHVKFIFATTEVGKVPVTVLSRTQRFDLKRIPAELLADHFRRITETEGAAIEDDALKLIAAAAEGSVRDGLSLLDQAIAHGSAGGSSAGSADGDTATADTITASAVREMLGLADRGRTRALLRAILTGDAAAALTELNGQFALGIAPDMAIEGMLETVHAVTRTQVGASIDLVMSEEGRAEIAGWAETIPAAALHRFWQLLLKGLEEVRRGTMALEAAEMAILRLIHAAQMPDPGSLIRALEGAVTDVPVVRQPAPKDEPARTPEPVAVAPPPLTDMPQTAGATPIRPAAIAPTGKAPNDADALIALVEQEDPLLGLWLHDDVGIVRHAVEETGELILAGHEHRANAAALGRLLSARFARPVNVRFDPDATAPSARERGLAAARAEREAVLADGNVRRLLTAFPDAELVDYQIGNETIGADNMAENAAPPDIRERNMQ
ncbi:MAG: DNA polymerase III subunit gamma/tau [Pseudomonadota bacterium]